MPGYIHDGKPHELVIVGKEPVSYVFVENDILITVMTTNEGTKVYYQAILISFSRVLEEMRASEESQRDFILDTKRLDASDLSLTPDFFGILEGPHYLKDHPDLRKIKLCRITDDPYGYIKRHATDKKQTCYVRKSILSSLCTALGDTHEIRRMVDHTGDAVEVTFMLHDSAPVDAFYQETFHQLLDRSREVQQTPLFDVHIHGVTNRLEPLLRAEMEKLLQMFPEFEKEKNNWWRRYQDHVIVTVQYAEAPANLMKRRWTVAFVEAKKE